MKVTSVDESDLLDLFTLVRNRRKHKTGVHFTFDSSQLAIYIAASVDLTPSTATRMYTISNLAAPRRVIITFIIISIRSRGRLRETSVAACLLQPKAINYMFHALRHFLLAFFCFERIARHTTCLFLGWQNKYNVTANFLREFIELCPFESPLFVCKQCEIGGTKCIPKFTEILK